LHSRSPSTAVSELMNELEVLTAEATPRQRTLEQRWSAWQQFVLERDAATVQLDALRRPLESMNSKPPVPLADARQDLDALKVCVDLYPGMCCEMLSLCASECNCRWHTIV
jgi:hypothetical protein